MKELKVKVKDFIDNYLVNNALIEVAITHPSGMSSSWFSIYEYKRSYDTWSKQDKEVLEKAYVSSIEPIVATLSNKGLVTVLHIYTDWGYEEVPEGGTDNGN